MNGNGIITSNKAADTLEAMVAGRCGKRDVKRLIADLPTGHRWKILKGYNTLSTVSTGELPAITELLTNAIDANIRLRATERAIKTGRPTSGQEFDGMFRSPRHAAAELFGIPDGELAKWEGHEQAWLACRVASLILELGDDGNCKGNPTVKIVDRGIGQPGSRFMDTFLNVTEGDKSYRPWEVGTYGLGSVVAARVCPYQVLVSKRPGGEWAILIIRTEMIESEAGERMVCSALVYGDDGHEEFPTLPHGTELHVDETYFVKHLFTEKPSDADINAMVRQHADRYQRSRGEATDMRCEILEPTERSREERGVVARARFVARRPLPHGTVRILVDATFTESWARQAIGGNSGVFRLIQRAMPDPILPFLVVENRLSPGVASIETGEKNALAMFGRTSPLAKAASEPGGALIRIPIDGIKIDGVDMGGVDVSVYYSPGGFSDELRKFAALPCLIRAGSWAGEGNTHDFVTMIGFSKFTDRFACNVSIDRLRSDPQRLSKVYGAGRSCNGEAVAELWKKVVSAVKENEEMERIREELRKDQSLDRDKLAEQISRALGGQGGGADGETILSGKKRCPVCVKGTDAPKTDRPDYVWIDRWPKFDGKERSFETLRPVRVERGKPSKMRVATSSRRRIDFSRKGCAYKLEVYVEGGGVEAKVEGNSLEVTASRAVKNARPATVVVYATDDSGFKSVAGVVKVLPAKPRAHKPRAALLPEPTFVKIRRDFANLKLPVGRTEAVRFNSDAEASFGGFSGEVQHRGHSQPVRVENIGEGRGRALIPALDGAKAGDRALLVIAANVGGTVVACCSEELVVVREKAPVGIAAIRRNERAIIDAPGDDGGGLKIVFEDEEHHWGLKERGLEEFEAVIIIDDCEPLGVVNKLAPSFVASKRGVDEEVSRERTVAGKERLRQLERTYYERVFMGLRDIEAEAGGVDKLEADGDRMDRAKHELRRVARCTEFMRAFDAATGVNCRRYVKYADPADCLPAQQKSSGAATRSAT